MRIPRIALCLASILSAAPSAVAEGGGGTRAPLWRIDREGGDFALAPAGYAGFQQNFGRPDHAYYVGLSDPRTDWPYVLPGVSDMWSGSHYNAKTHNEWDQMNTLPIGFVLERTAAAGDCELAIGFRDDSPRDPPRIRITVNGAIFETALLPGGSEASLKGDFAGARPQTIRVDFPGSLLRVGYNEIALRTTSGSWCVFDAVSLDAPAGVALAPAGPTVIRSVTAPPYAVSEDAATPATIRVEVFREGGPEALEVRAGDGPAREVRVEPGLQAVEIPAPASAVGSATRVRVSAKGAFPSDTNLSLAPSPPATPADYVDVFAGTAHSRWMIAPGPWMPFSMVKIAPDNQVQSWCAGYDYTHEYIDCFSHIHEWTMSGLGMMPTLGPLRTHPGLDGAGYSSRFDKSTERGGIGYYGVLLKDSGVKVELTATTRASLQRYTFPASEQARIVMPFLLPNEYETHVPEARVRRMGRDEIEGDVRTVVPNAYGCTQSYTLHFVAQFSRPFDAMGGWQNLGGADVTIPRGRDRPPAEAAGSPPEKLVADARELEFSGDCGAFVTFATRAGEAVEVRTGISLVSVADARLNLERELSGPFGWDFGAVVRNQQRVWNDLFDRVEIETPDAREKTRFYTNLYRSLSGRNTWSDVNGDWVDAYGRLQRMRDPDAVMLGSDALWTTFWSLNQVMNLMAPEWSASWVKSELAMYDTCGWLAKGPAGLKYISVMVAEHEIPLLVGAYQAGIAGLDPEKILAASVKMQTTPPQRVAGGKAGNENLMGYLKYHYVPSDGHDKGKTSNTFEYAYDDWCVAQLALALGHTDAAKPFLARSQYWRNVFDPVTGFARPKSADGRWVTPFDPYRTPGFVEADAWQYTWFVPQDVPGLVEAMGRDRFVSRLDGAFVKMEATRFNAAGDRMAEFPLNQGNETCMQAPWLFNFAGAPWLTQKWTRAVLDAYYGWYPGDAYLGDEDQGQMAAWFVMSAIGLYQMDGGCSGNPHYELGSPLYPRITIHLSPKYHGGGTFVIEAPNASPENHYIQSATLNGRPLDRWWIRQRDVVAGGRLVLDLGPEPNPNWTRGCPEP